MEKDTGKEDMWQRKAIFYKKQLDDLKILRFETNNTIKNLEKEVELEKSRRINYYRKMGEFRSEVIKLLNKKLMD